MGYFFKIINPYSTNRQGVNAGTMHRIGVHSEDLSICAKRRPLPHPGALKMKRPSEEQPFNGHLCKAPVDGASAQAEQ